MKPSILSVLTCAMLLATVPTMHASQRTQTRNTSDEQKMVFQEADFFLEELTDEYSILGILYIHSTYNKLVRELQNFTRTNILILKLKEKALQAIQKLQQTQKEMLESANNIVDAEDRKRMEDIYLMSFPYMDSKIEFSRNQIMKPLMFKPLKSLFLRILATQIKQTIEKTKKILEINQDKKTLKKYEEITDFYIKKIEKELKGALHYNLIKKNSTDHKKTLEAIKSLKNLLQRILEEKRILEKRKKQKERRKQKKIELLKKKKRKELKKEKILKEKKEKKEKEIQEYLERYDAGI